jgi:hypothetical protein
MYYIRFLYIHALQEILGYTFQRRSSLPLITNFCTVLKSGRRGDKAEGRKKALIVKNNKSNVIGECFFYIAMSRCLRLSQETAYIAKPHSC